MQCRTNILGIKIVYCDSDGEKEHLWVDLKKVHALSWCDEEVKEKGKGKGPSKNEHVPRDPNGPGECKPERAANGRAPLCWWDGTAWICGTE